MHFRVRGVSDYYNIYIQAWNWKQMCALEVSVPAQGFGGGFEEILSIYIFVFYECTYAVDFGSSEWAKE
jgi:hypothetical protein